MGIGAWLEGETQDHWFNNVICWDPLHTRVAVTQLVHPPCSPLLGHLLNSYSFYKAQLKCSPSPMTFYLLQKEEIFPTLEPLWLWLSRAVTPKRKTCRLVLGRFSQNRSWRLKHRFPGLASRVWFRWSSWICSCKRCFVWFWWAHFVWFWWESLWDPSCSSPNIHITLECSDLCICFISFPGSYHFDNPVQFRDKKEDYLWERLERASPLQHFSPSLITASRMPCCISLDQIGCFCYTFPWPLFFSLQQQCLC